MLVLGYIGRLAILYSGGVNVLVDFLHPVAVGYWLAMAVIKTVINELCPTVLFMEAGSSPSNYGGGDDRTLTTISAPITPGREVGSPRGSDIEDVAVAIQRYKHYQFLLAEGIRRHHENISRTRSFKRDLLKAMDVVDSETTCGKNFKPNNLALDNLNKAHDFISNHIKKYQQVSNSEINS